MYRFFAAVLCFSAFSAQVKAQEKVTPLQNNHTLEKHIANNPLVRKKHHPLDTLQLPFFDDFSTSVVYPDQSKWYDRNVFINSTFPVNPISINVATFDGLDEFGRPYDKRIVNNATYGADTLTSMAINLSGYTPADSIYLSFFYQPEGLGDAPEAADFFTLEFKSDSSKWFEVWRAHGTRLHPFRAVNLSLFHVSDTNNYYHSGFQFRFVSHGNLTGNLDHWHLDYVMMNFGRNHADTVFTDIAVIETAPSLLRRYNSMPWKQFAVNPGAEWATEVSFRARNLDNATRNTAFGYQVLRLPDSLSIHTNFNQSVNLDPNSIQTLTLPLNVPINNLGGDTVSLLVKTAVQTIPDDFTPNDTSYHTQIFANYYAYDDGTAEGGYGLDNNVRSGKVALRFNLNVPDTLRAIAIHFNESRTDVTHNTFTLKVWKQLTPLGQYDDHDEVLLRIEDLNPRYRYTHNGFYYYMLEEPIALPAGEFYIGWLQTSNFHMNIGYDKNNNRVQDRKTGSNPNLFFNTQGVWHASQLPGNPMMRPVLGGEFIITNVKKPQLPELEFGLVPNPANTHFTITSANNNLLDIRLTDLTGRVVLQQQTYANTQLPLPYLPQGMYMVHVTDSRNGHSAVKKLMVR